MIEVTTVDPSPIESWLRFIYVPLYALVIRLFKPASYYFSELVMFSFPLPVGEPPNSHC